MRQSLLTINTGSSSVKFRLFALDSNLTLLAGGKVSDIGGAPTLDIRREGSPSERRTMLPQTTHEDALDAILNWLQAHEGDVGTFSVAAHRVVHGGVHYTGPTYLDLRAMEYLRSLSSLAPLHQPHNLACVDILGRKRPDIKQYGCFDTAFHARHDLTASSFALPKYMRDAGIRRYGFHGLSYDWIAHSLRRDYPHLAAGRVVAAHLGNGASLCAMKDGKSIDSSMGMTSLDGVPMGTRSGCIDAGAVIYMQRTLGLSLDKVEHVLCEESGLKGLSGISNDVKILSESPQESAKFALDYFARKVAQFVGSMAVAIGGMDGLIFTGGIGENAKNVRDAILSYLTFLPPFETIVIAANEERSMALEILENFSKEIKTT